MGCRPFRPPPRSSAGRSRPGGVILESDTVAARLIVQAARRPGLSFVHQELLDFAGDEFYLIDEPALADRPFGDALLSYPTSSVVGMMRGDTLVLNPPSQTPMAADDLLLVISRDDDTAWLDDCAECTSRPSWTRRRAPPRSPTGPTRPP
ncbi:CASTOR/POLLUX-related putative ion channel [Streptomyces cellulosae]|uniref:CASTOR/POLLUX-related putative ion channel n=1 Tax=Streptomyces cellulosae TaxID=1968 RepID=UPI000AAA0818